MIFSLLIWNTSITNIEVLIKDSESFYIIVYAIAFAHVPFKLLSFQVSVLADDILKNVEYDALRIVFNKFHSVVQFLPTTATVLSPEVMEMLNLNVHYFYKKIVTFLVLPLDVKCYVMLCPCRLWRERLNLGESLVT